MGILCNARVKMRPPKPFRPAPRAHSACLDRLRPCSLSLRQPRAEDFNVTWSTDGASVGLVYPAEVIAMIVAGEKRGHSRALSRDGPLGLPFDDALAAKTFHKDGFHYFRHYDLGSEKKYFRISDAELSWEATFPLTHYRKDWRALNWGVYERR